jgi:hypothetical protein
MFTEQITIPCTIPVCDHIILLVVVSDVDVKRYFSANRCKPLIGNFFSGGKIDPCSSCD